MNDDKYTHTRTEAYTHRERDALAFERSEVHTTDNLF